MHQVGSAHSSSSRFLLVLKILKPLAAVCHPVGGVHLRDEAQVHQVGPVEFCAPRLRRPRIRERPLNRIRRRVLDAQIASLMVPASATTSVTLLESDTTMT